ncbi:MAG: DUF721 domain-containing protein [Verrucomicrobiales bacterium]
MKQPIGFIPPRSWHIKRSPKEKALASWRGIDLKEAEKAAEPSIRPVSSVVDKLLGELKLDRRLSDLEIVKVWDNLVDPMVAKHAQPSNLHKGTLFITVDSSVWLNEIVRWRRQEILERLQASFGKDRIQKISFRVG